MGPHLSTEKQAQLQDVSAIATAFNEMVSAGKDCSQDHFCTVLEKAICSRSRVQLDDQGRQSVSLGIKECFRILAKGKLFIDKNDLRRARDELAEIHRLHGGSAGILDTVLLGKYTAAKSFRARKYTVSILEEETTLYRVGNEKNFLGQYFTRNKPSDLVDMRKTFAIKDDWHSAGVTFHEVFAPKINTVYTVKVPAGLFIYEGIAASLTTFMAVDELASSVFEGGGEQIMIVAPWNVGGSEWIHESQELDPGSPWDLLQYEATDVCKRAFAGDLQGADFARIQEVSTKFNLSPLHHACMCNDASKRLTTVETLLEQKADPNSAHYMGLTPLMIAAQIGDVDVVRRLIEKDINVLGSQEQQLGRTPLHFAAQQGSSEVVSALLADQRSSTLKLNIDAKDMEGHTPLWVACHYGNSRAAEVLLERGADANIPNKHFETPLLTAVANKHHEVVRLLLNRDRDNEGPCSQPIKHEFDLLHKAVASGCSEVVKELACLGPRFGLKVNAARTSSTKGDTALHLAVIRNDERCVKALMCSEEVDASTKCYSGWTPLHLAVQKPAFSIAVIRALLDCSNNHINETTPDLSTALILAAELDKSEDSRCIVEELLTVQGIDVNASNKYGYTALYVAAGKGNTATVKLLCNHEDIILEAPDGEGWRPLHRAARNGHIDAVNALLEARADINATNEWTGKSTCLAVAKSRTMHAYLKSRAQPEAL